LTIDEAYALLGLDPRSTAPNQARERFRDLIRANHPDGKPLPEQAEANQTTRLLIEAYALLRTEGFPRSVRSRRYATSGGVGYEPQAATQPEPADPLAWVDEVWRESVRSDAPETAIAKAILRAVMWGFAGAVLLFAGIVLMVGAIGTLSARTAGPSSLFVLLFGVIAACGARLAVAAWSMSYEVARYWNVFRNVASPAAVAAVRWKIASRLCAVAAVLLGGYIAMLLLNH